MDGSIPTRDLPTAPTRSSRLSSIWSDTDAPATEREIGGALQALRLIFGQPPGWSAQTVKLYVEALADLPARLLDRAVKGCIRSCKFFPRPAEIREQVKGEIEAATEAFNARLRLQLPAPATRPPPTLEEIAAVEAKVAAYHEEAARKGITHRKPRRQGALPPHSEPDDQPLRPLGEILAGYRLPDWDDPRAIDWLKKMVEAEENDG